MNQILLDRLLEKTKLKESGNINDCWNWSGTKNREGYGIMMIKNKLIRIHRISYELFIKKIPKDKVIDHLCNNTSCFNPIHLKATTAAKNTMRGNGICAKYARRTHCPKGHDLSDPNNLTKFGMKKGIRQCKICVNENYRNNYYVRGYANKRKDTYNKKKGGFRS